MKVLVRPNFLKKHSVDVYVEVVKKLQSLNFTVLVTQEDYSVVKFNNGCIVGDINELLQQCDVIMPIGGDGTVLHELGNALSSGKPLLGINAGRIGFLTELEPSELNKLELLKNKSFRLSSRMLIEAAVENDKQEKRFCGLNDVVIKRLGFDLGLIDLNVFGDNGLVISQRGDGMIFATPTGSTAYSLSAGGPVLAPEMNGIIMSTICPHSTFQSSIVLSDTNSYIVKESDSSINEGFSVIVDGQCVHEVEPGGNVIIRKSDFKISLIDLGIRNFYERLNDKLVYM